jgi:hypothetical protein
VVGRDDTYRYELVAHPGRSKGAARYDGGLLAHTCRRPAHTGLSPERSPYPELRNLPPPALPGQRTAHRHTGYDGTADAKRKRQARRVAELLEQYDLKKEWVVVAGDLNDSPTSPPLQPLLNVDGLHDVLQLQFPDQPAKRWTYHYDKFEQIDFVLVSEALKDRFRKAGVERRGIYGLHRLTSRSNGEVEVELEYEDVTSWRRAASDHGAVWAEFSLVK